MWPTTDLVDEAPGDADALLDVSDDAVARLEARVVVQGRPDLRAHLLKIIMQHCFTFTLAISNIILSYKQ